ncbi:hypothetical protein Ddye_014638 [Dipteronia dyeriana]|uniref:Reverse transcriptase zinc-binding domain-containing protein n=1 Tax=Dipteronia dyeriana TaxID=168575 RepID=A0AAD9X8N4_9ROSI|nr:hypothetical protein Ddye_014638 [Dipteronia dyeriana]
MLAKWVWRYGKENDLLWRKVICSKYGEDPHGIRWSWDIGSNVSLFVKAVSSLFKEGSQSRRILDEGLKIVVGNGESVNFWFDMWCDNLALKDRFPRIFALAMKKVGAINTFGGWHEDRWIWKVQLRRRVFDWEREVRSSFYSCTNNVRIQKGVGDSVA